MAAVAAAVGACILFGPSASAQPTSGVPADTRLALARRAPARRAPMVEPSPVRVYAGDEANWSAPVELPANLTVTKSLRNIAEMMLQRSAIFRRQCLRIADATHLTISIGRFHPLPAERARARTRFSRRGGMLHADVEIAPLTDVVELIAHEIEHVIEQLDGIDLKLQASLRGTAASVCPDGSFETVRAVRTGLAAAREVDQFR